jgi:hypothetical protein
MQSVLYLSSETARFFDVFFNACGCWIAAQIDTEGLAPVVGYARYIPGYTQKADLADVFTREDGRINLVYGCSKKPGLY